MTHPHDPSATPVRRRTRLERLVWPGGLIAMVLALVTVDITMLTIATGDKSFAVAQVDGDPSEAWNARRRQERANDALGWSTDFRVDLPVGRPAQAVIELSDVDGRPLTGATISLVAFHHARASQRLKAVLSPDPDVPGTYRGSVRIGREGRWAFELACEQDGQRFTTEAERYILLPMAAATPEAGTVR